MNTVLGNLGSESPHQFSYGYYENVEMKRYASDEGGSGLEIPIDIEDNIHFTPWSEPPLRCRPIILDMTTATIDVKNDPIDT
jgi:hypothetical protein